MQKVRHNIEHTIGVLSEDIGVRSYSDLEGLNRTADYIEDGFRACGYMASRQAFGFEGRTYYNISAELKGDEPDVVVVGAHYDTVSGSPGADDNASGVAGVLELARLFGSERPRHTMRFVAFCLEEPPVFRTSCMGSAVYAKSLREEGVPVKGMISLEMIGYYCHEKGCQYYPLSVFKLRYPDTGDFIAFVGNIASRGFTRAVRDGFKAHSDFPVTSLNTVRAVPGIDFSDHRSFWEYGFDAFMVTDTAFYRNPHYHTVGDTARTLDYDGMAEVVKGLYYSLRNLP
jgi:Zn-dependent M28 family amino/carboxypeptidase